MCLISKYRFPKIAKRNIRCDKKVFILDNQNIWKPFVWRENCIEYKYNEIIQPHTKDGNILEHLTSIPSVFYDDKFDIHEGFHSCKKGVLYKSDYTKIAVIPKGAEYFEGIYDDLVSNKIIVFSDRKAYWRWRIKNLFGRA